MAPARYVPAWRRIGLKLKSEEQAVNGDAQSSHDIQEPISKRRRLEQVLSESRSDNDGEAPRSFKNSGEERIDTARSVENASALQTMNGIGNSHHSPGSAQDPPPRRKSVTFSPDTKTSDGDSSKRLMAQASSLHLSQESGLNAAAIEAATKELHSISAPLSRNNTAKSKEKAPKKRKERKPDKNPNTTASNGTITNTPSKQPVLDYLTTYHTARDDWRFNKTKQSALFRCIFNIDHLPQSYDDAVYAYVAGLQGEGIRNKLLDEALKISRRGAEATGGARDEGRERSKNVQRAELVLRALTESLRTFPGKKREGREEEEEEEAEDSDVAREPEVKVDEPEPTVSERRVVDKKTDFEEEEKRGPWQERKRAAPDKKAENAGKPVKKKRKRVRKRRTDIESDISSSSESSSSSSSSSDENESSRKATDETSALNGQIAKREPQTKSSSSSSSDSEPGSG